MAAQGSKGAPATLEERSAQAGLGDVFAAFPGSVRAAAERASKPLQLPAGWTPTTEPAHVFIPIVSRK
jgi:hypothetical protein